MIMNLKETIITSSFFHLILLLLMIAVSSHQGGLSGGLQSIISVDLAMQDSRDQAAVRSEHMEEPQMSVSPPSSDEAGIPEPALTAPTEEAAKDPATEAEVEPATEQPAKIENEEQHSIQRGGFSSMEAYREFIRLHTKVFGQKAGARVNELVGEALKENQRIFFGGMATVNLDFGPDGKLSGVMVDSDSADLKAFLDEISWAALPAPAAFSLGYPRVLIEFTVLQGYLSFRINALPVFQ